MPVAFMASLMVTESEKLVFPFLFELTKSFLSDGHHVHLITKTKIEDVPLTIDKSEDLCVDSLSRLTIKYLENAQQLIQYAIDLQFMLSRQGGKPPKAILIQGLQNYFDSEDYGDMALALLLSALKALSSSMKINVELFAGYEVNPNRPSQITLEFLKTNFFKRSWHFSLVGQNGVIKELDEEKRITVQMLFTIQKSVVSINNKQFLTYFRIPEH
ncbi:uncharacterized protein LOC111056500 [Nilaparvata lugens]|uniref:uncharacterized protein LOC111056500 n=1 Tax=Nilaparvata lugens TaxID=108931 RepID=UPI00193E1F1C|nr:uncharacterized protein LOC111056500 [Nilaparvata lugens]